MKPTDTTEWVTSNVKTSERNSGRGDEVVRGGEAVRKWERERKKEREIEKEREGGRESEICGTSSRSRFLNSVTSTRPSLFKSA